MLQLQLLSGRKPCLAAALLLLLGAMFAFAQSSGSLVVTVSDKSGGTVADASLELQNIATGQTRTALSSGTGAYTFDLIPSGVYRLKVSKPGFAPLTVDGINVQVNTVARQNVTLEVATVASQVNVEANAAQIIVDTPALGEVIETKTITDLPLNGRDFLQLATLSAGVAPPIKPIGGANPFQSVAQGFSSLRPTLVVSVSGVREASADYLFDGIPSRQQFYGAVGLQPPVDSIDEFKIMRGYFSPEFGQPAVINVVTKSGTNALHGTAWEFFRNDALDARSFFDRQKAPWRMNQFGFNLGGPIIKNKLFWFGDYEGQRTRQFTQSFATVPTDAMFAGDFSGLPTIFDPSTYDPATGTKQPFAGNQVPGDRISGFSQKYRRFFPAPNTSTLTAVGNANLAGQTNETLNEDKWSIKLDYVISEKDSIFGRFSYMNSGDVITNLFPTRGQDSPLNSRNAVIGWTHVFSPTVVNDFRAGLDRAFQSQGGPLQDLGSQDWPTYLGLQNLNQISECNAAPNVSILGFSTAGVGNPNCIIPSNTNKIFRDNLSLIRGKHSLSFGGEYTRLFYRNIAALNPLGSLSFTGAYTGNGVADYLLGNPFTVSGSKPAAPGYMIGFLGSLYANDDFKVSNKFTLNFGLRWQIAPPMLEKYDRLGVFDQTTGLIDIAGQNGNSRRLLTTFYRDFSPRVGFAYAPTPNWSIRSSYGLYYDRPPGNDLAWNNIKWPFQIGYAQVGDPHVPTINVAGLFPTTAPGQLPAVGTSLFNYSDRSGDPYLQQWTFSVQRSLPGSIVLETAYVGSKGTHLSKRTDLNLAPLAVPGDTRPVQLRRPYPQWSFILSDGGIGVSNYQGLQITLRKEYSHGLTILGGYTWSRSMDSDSFDSKASRNYHPGDRDYGRSIFDLRNRGTASVLYELPFAKGAKGFTGAVASGWELSTIVTLQSGLPMTVLEPFDQSNTGVIVSWARPNRVCDGNLPPGQRTPTHWF
ncbi:MAG: TonB-dependent receptor, partial [Acidobacteria bacterium]|nr:TonB-dependent receptor [Acidobacteriota bacterium]